MTLAGAALAGVVALLTTPRYESTATFTVVSDGDKGGLAELAAQFGGLGDLAGLGALSSTAGKSEAMALLRSRALSERFVRGGNLLPILFADKWNPATKRWTVQPDDVPTVNQAVRFFSEKVRRINVDQKAGTISLTVTWTDPRVAARWCGDYLKLADSMLRERALADASKSIEFLQLQLNEAQSVELRSSVAKLLESQLKTRMLATTRSEYAFSVIDPPAVADQDGFVAPKPVSMILAGIMAGFFLALLWIVVSGPERAVAQTRE